MSAIQWLKDASGDFATGANWNGGKVPGAGDDVLLTVAGATPYTVTSSASETVNSVQTSTIATLAIDNSFTITSGSGSGANAGTIAVEDNANLLASGTFNNTGTVALNGSVNGDTLQVLVAGLTMNGGGRMVLSDFSGNAINAQTSSSTLTNVDNTISGAGAIGTNSGLTFVNQAKGIVDANATSNVLQIDTGGSGKFTNAGLVEATGAAGLTIFNTTGTNSGQIEALGSGVLRISSATITSTGVVSIASGSQINLSSMQLFGGSLTIAAGGKLDANSSNSLAAPSTFSNAGVIAVEDNASLQLSGTLANTGMVAMSGSVNGATLQVLVAGLTLEGTGKVVLSDFSGNTIDGQTNTSTLTNVDNTISGAGNIGTNSGLTFVNQAKGIVDGNATNNALVIDTGGSGKFTNAGLVEATGAAGLVIYNTTGTNSGQIEAIGSGALTISSSTITNTGLISAAKSTQIITLNTTGFSGGTLTIAAGAQLNVNSGTLSIAVSTFTNAGAITIADGGNLAASGTLANTGTVTLNGSVSGDSLQILVAGLTLNGAGHVVLSDFSGNSIFGQTNTSTLTNVDNTISGGGNIGTNSGLTFVNQAKGIIDANATNNVLVIDTGGSGKFTNAGLIEATGSAGLTIYNTTGTNSGQIEAIGSGALTISSSTITNTGLISAAKSTQIITLNTTGFSGGTLTIAAGAQLNVNSGTLSIAVSTFTNAGAITIADGGNLAASGTLANTGTVTLNGSVSGDSLQILVAGLTLNGAGHVVLSDFSGNSIFGQTNTSTLTNVDNTISGGGNIGTNSGLTFVNQAKGIVDGNASSNVLAIDTGGSGKFTNAGLVEATGSAGLTIYNTTGTNSGQIEAIGSGALTISSSTITNTGLISAAKSTQIITLNTTGFSGGTLTIAAGAQLNVNSGTLSIAVSTFTNAGAITIADGGNLAASGTLANTGTVTLNGSVSGDSLQILVAGLTLNGAGHVVLSDFSGNSIFGQTNTSTLTNVDNTISGGGNIGTNSGLTFVNQAKGIIDANATNNVLVIDTGGSGKFTNAGLIETKGAAGLTIYNTTGTNSGQIEAIGKGILLIQNSTISQSGSGTILGASGQGVHLQNAHIEGGVLATTGTTRITTTDTSSVLDGTVSAVSNQGSLFVADNTALRLEGAIHNSGTFTIVGSSNSASLFIGTSNVTLNGGGQIVLRGTHGRVLGLASSATLTNVDNTISGAGFVGAGQMTLVNDAAGVIDSNVGGGIILRTDGQTLTNAGLLESTATGFLVIANTTVDDSKGGKISAGARVDIQNSDIIGGTITSSGNGVLVVNALGAIFDGTSGHAVTMSGRLVLGDNTSLNLMGSIVDQGSITLTGSANVTELAIGATGATLTGGGEVVLSNRTLNHIDAAATATLTNVDNSILGGGTIGNANLTLINDKAGFISSIYSAPLVIDTGANTVINAGKIEAQAGGGIQVRSAVDNTGLLVALNSNLTIDGAVNGNGTAKILGGTMAFALSFNQDVSFVGQSPSGTLQLAMSQSYTATVHGFSHTPSTTLDLLDIAFVSKNEASWSAGVLTVTDGKHTAHINLAGDFTGSIFIASDDGHGGVSIVDPPAQAPAQPPAAASFAASMASFAAPASAPAHPAAPAHAASRTLLMAHGESLGRLERA